MTKLERAAKNLDAIALVTQHGRFIYDSC